VCKKCCKKNTSPEFDFCSPDCRNRALKDGEIGKVDVPAPDPSTPPEVVRQCKVEGCSWPVYWEYWTEFDYCSPTCRDKDLLEGNHKELHYEIHQMESALLEQGHSLRSKKGCTSKFIICPHVPC